MNMEMVMDRRLADRRIFPAMDINRSSTRKEELLLDEDVLTKIWVLRKFLAEMSSIDAMEFLRDRIKKAKAEAKAKAKAEPKAKAKAKAAPANAVSGAHLMVPPPPMAVPFVRVGRLRSE